MLQVSQSMNSQRAPSDTRLGFAALFQDGAPNIFCERGSTVFRGGDKAEYLYKVLTGAIFTCKILYDGSRHISSFYFPGDCFGLEASNIHALSAEAICDVTLSRVTGAAAQSDPTAAAELLQWGMAELSRANQHLVMLSQSADARVAVFLLEMNEHLGVQSQIELPANRLIADYLGLTTETVSRTLTRLTKKSLIQTVASRRLGPTNVAGLKCLSD